VPAYPLRVLVLRRTKLGEADLILTLLASDGHQVRAVAKGARKPGGRFGARVEPFTVLDVLLHTGRSLEVVSEARTVATHEAVRADYDRTTAASAMAGLLERISVEGQVEPQLFAMSLATLDAMETSPVNAVRPLVLAFVLKALAMHGVRPALGECAACAGVADPAYAISPAAGGVLCERCAREDEGSLPISVEAHAALRALMRAKMSDVAGLDISEQVQREVTMLLRAYLVFHVPGRIRALDFFAAGR
jgi:DNA repair protein RecO (recombination protein O)